MWPGVCRSIETNNQELVCLQRYFFYGWSRLECALTHPYIFVFVLLSLGAFRRDSGCRLLHRLVICVPQNSLAIRQISEPKIFPLHTLNVCFQLLVDKRLNWRSKSDSAVGSALCFETCPLLVRKRSTLG